MRTLGRGDTMTWKNTIRKSGIAKREVKFNTRQDRMYVMAEDYGNDDDLVEAAFEGDIILDWELEAVSYDEVRLQVNKLEFNGTLGLAYEDDSKDDEIAVNFEVDKSKIEVELSIDNTGNSVEALSFQVGVYDIDIDVDFMAQENISDAEIKALVRFE